MKRVKKGLNIMFDNDLLLVLSSVLMVVLGGLILNISIMYIFYPNIFSYIYHFDHIIIKVVSLSILLFIFSKVLKKYNLTKRFWIRVLGSVFLPFLISFLQIIIFGNTTMKALMIQINFPQVIKALIDLFNIVIPILSGLIFIKPWKSQLSFATGIIYVALMYTTLVFFNLLITGIVFDYWL